MDDVAARIGGEEFALLLTNTTAQDAQNIAERIRLTIVGHDATISPSLSAETCVERADKAMYQAKETGRNRVVVWEE